MTELLEESDARFLTAVVRDNERWNTSGITEADMSVVFEMNQRCGWGADFTVSRFRRAVKEMAKRADVEQRGDRWFPSTSKTLDRLDETGGRICERSGCGRNIDHLRASSRFCSPECRKRQHRRLP